MSVDKDLRNSVVVVTGANSGIGYEAALEFARQGATLVLVCRSQQKGEEALSSIVKKSGNSNIYLFLADFSQLSDVARLGSELLHAYPVIDVLCNNAGSVAATQQITKEGFETTLVVNHLSGFLLTQILMPGLLKSSNEEKARIVFTSSTGHRHSALDFDDLNLNQDFSTFKAYGRSKLMNLLTAKTLHQRYGDKVIVSAFHPGSVRTDIWSKGSLIGRLIGTVFYAFMINSKKGADTLIWLATSSDEASRNANGNYFYKRRPTKIAEFATDQSAEKLWDVSMKLVSPYLPDTTTVE